MTDTFETMLCGGRQFESILYFDTVKDGARERQYSCTRCGMIFRQKPDKCTSVFVLEKSWKGDPVNDKAEGVYQEIWYGFSKYIYGQRIEGMTWSEAKRIEGIKVE